MPSTKLAYLVLALVSYHINVLAEDPFTYEDLKQFTGVDFCAKNGGNLFEAMCTRLAKVKGIELHKPIEYDQTCLKQRLKISSTSAEKTKRPAISSLSCTFNANVEGHNKEAPTIYSVLGRGPQGNDVVEYSFPNETGEMDWRPVKVHSDFLDGLVPFTYEELKNDFTGEDFCLRNDEKLFEAMCTRIAKMSNIGQYSSYKLSNAKFSCVNLYAEFWSSEGKKNEPYEIPLLWCRFNIIEMSKRFTISKTLGIGRRGNDIAEYSFLPGTKGNNIWQPVKVHSDFLYGLVLFTYEELTNDFTGNDFCAKEDPKLFRQMCNHLAKVKNIDPLKTIGSGNSCTNSPAEIWSSVGEKDAHPRIPLLLCRFNFEIKNGEKLISMYRGLGKGRQGNDVVEYSLPYGTLEPYWRPVAEHSNFFESGSGSN